MVTTTREQQAVREIGTTDVSRGVARALSAGFLLSLLAVPAIQWGSDLQEFANGRRAAPWPTATEIVSAPSVAVRTWSATEGHAARRLFKANAQLINEIQRYEEGLEDLDVTTGWLLGPTRGLLARWFGWGTDEAWIGRDGWLFYRPDLDYVTGPGFLDPPVLVRRSHGGKEFSAQRHPDPRPAILDLTRQLSQRGIGLVLVPTPSKAMVHPGHFCQDSDRPLHNSSFQTLCGELRAAGIRVFDPLELMKDRARLTRKNQFLAGDTHWRPGAMQHVAETLTRFLVTHGHANRAGPSPAWKHETVNVTNRGDLVDMLRLSDAGSVFADETVALHRVLETDGGEWKPDTAAEILLLGDSYSNIYSAAPMGWGSSAGLAEQLAWQLNQPVDRIARNADGAQATRRQLARELASGRDRLAGKRVVVWQFAVRELTSGDWPLIGLAATGVSPPPPGVAGATGSVRFRGTVLATSGVPAPGSVPYRNAILSLHVVDADGHQRIVFCLGMKDNRLQPVSRLGPGDLLTARLVPWTTVQRQYGRLVRIELDDPDFQLIDLPTSWGELE